MSLDCANDNYFDCEKDYESDRDNDNKDYRMCYIETDKYEKDGRDLRHLIRDVRFYEHIFKNTHRNYYDVSAEDIVELTKETIYDFKKWLTLNNYTLTEIQHGRAISWTVSWTVL